MKKRGYILLRNITSNFFTQFWLLGLSFLTTPYIFHKFGAARYGLLTLLNTIPGYFSVLDLGLIPALVKYLAEFKAKNKKLESLLSTAFSLYTLLILFWGVIIFFAARSLAEKVLKIPPELTATGLTTLKLIALSFVLGSLGTFFASIPQALQRFEIYNLKHLFLGTVIPLGTVLLLVINKGLIEVIYLHIITNGLVVFLFYFIARRLLPKTSFGVGFSLPALKKLLSFGGFKFISSINARIVFQLNQFLIATFLPIQLVSFYAIPANLVQKAVGLLPNITTPLFPLFSELGSLALKDKLVGFYKRSIKMSSFLVVPLFLFLFFFAHLLLSLWIGKEFANQATLILKILSIAYLLASFSGVPAIVAEGIGKPQIPAFFSTLGALLYLIFALLLIPRFGLTGAALAVLFNRIIQVPIFVYFVTHRVVGVEDPSFYLKNYIKFILLGGVVALLLLPFSSLPTSLWQVGCLFIFYGVIFTSISLFSKAIDRKDQKILRGFILRLFKFSGS